MDMRKFLNRFSKRTWIIVGVSIGLVILLILLFRPGRPDPSQAFQTEAISRGDLIATVGATGSVRAQQSAILNWLTSGIVESVKVKVGENVAQGQVLATLLKTSLPQNVILAEVDLVEAQKVLNDLLGSDTARAQALIDLKKAQDEYESAYNYRVELNKKGWFKKVVVKTVNHQLVPEIKWYRGFADVETIAKADDQLALKKAQLEDAQRGYDRLESGPNPADVTAAEARVAAAYATLNMSKIISPFAGTVTQVDPSLNIPDGVSSGDNSAGMSPADKLVIPAPDSTNLSIPSTEISGEQVSQGSFAFRVDDLSSLLVDVQISEVDINTIELNQDATLTFDAILENNYHGNVVNVSQAGDTVEGVVNFTVTIELVDADELVKPGMTAAVNIVVTELTDVLLVPNRAVRIREKDRVVYTLVDGKLTPVKVSLGQSSDSDSVLLEGDLHEGDLVVLNPPTSGPNFFGAD
jgi:HlyD family secretion protein